MAFDPILNANIQPGEPVTGDLWSKTRLNLDDHEGRLLTLEGSLNAFLTIKFTLNGPYGLLGDKINYALIERIPFSLTVVAVRVWIEFAGSSGTTECDVLFKRGAAAYDSILTTNPSVASAAGNQVYSSNGVLDVTKKFLLAGDTLRADLISSQGGEPRSIQTIVEFEKT